MGRPVSVFLTLLVHHIEDLTRVVILHEICETSLRRVSKISYEMTMSVRFCLSYDTLQLYFIAFKMDNISRKNTLVSGALSMTLRLRPKVLLHVWSYDFYDDVIH